MQVVAAGACQFADPYCVRVISRTSVLHALLLACTVATAGCRNVDPRAPGDDGSEQLAVSELTVLPAIPEPQPEKIAEAHLNLGMAYLRRGELNKALDRLDKSRAQKADNPLLYNVYALVYQALGEALQAEENFRRALRMDQDNSRVRNNYGQFLCEQKRYPEARKLLLSVLDDPLYESPQIVYVNLASCARDQGDSDQAYHYYQEALSRAPGFSSVILYLGELDLERGDYQQARQRLQEYLLQAAHTARSAWLGVQIERVLGDQDALASYALLLRNKFPDSPQAAWYRQGSAPRAPAP